MLQVSRQMTHAVQGPPALVRPQRDSRTAQEDPSELILMLQEKGALLEGGPDPEEYYGESEPLPWNPRDLLNFAVVDLDETVTRAVTAWLSDHPSIKMLSLDRDDSQSAHDPFRLVNAIRKSVEEGKDVIRGYRVGLDHDDEYNALRTYWPKTKLVVVLRHPVRWFEDFCNRYIQTIKTPLVETNRLIGACNRLGQTICTDKADVAFSLLKLGKTMKGPSPLTRQILHENRLRQNMSGVHIPVHPNPVFLVTWEQLTGADMDKQTKLVNDLEYFLGVRSDLPRLRLPLDERLLGTKMPKDPQTPSIDICESRYLPLRKALMDISQRSAQWILDDFLATTTVTCSQTDWFAEHLKTWMDDPCSQTEQNS